MKKFAILLQFVGFVAVPAFGQSAFTEAMTLEDQLQKYNAAVRLGDAQDMKKAIDEIAKRLMAVSGQAYESKNSIGVIASRTRGSTANPFFQNVSTLKQMGDGAPNSAETVVGGTSAEAVAPGLTATSFAAGVSRFLLDRAQQELLTSFVEQFKAKIADFPELRVLFPETCQYLGVTTGQSNPDRGLFGLKTVFQNDLLSLPQNVMELGQTDLDLQGLGIAARVRWQSYRMFWQSEGGAWVAIGTTLMSGIIQGGSTVKTLEQCVARIPRSVDDNAPWIRDYLQLIVFLAKGIQVEGKDSSPTWLGPDRVGQLVHNAEIRNLFFGVLYEMAKQSPVPVIHNQFTRFLDISARLDAPLESTLGLFRAFAKLGNASAQWAEAPPNTAAQFAAIGDFLRATADLFDGSRSGLLLTHVIEPDAKEARAIATSMRQGTSLLRSISDLFAGVVNRDYSAVFGAAVPIIASVFDSDSLPTEGDFNDFSKRIAALKASPKASKDFLDSLKKLNEYAEEMRTFGDMVASIDNSQFLGTLGLPFDKIQVFATSLRRASGNLDDLLLLVSSLHDRQKWSDKQIAEAFDRSVAAIRDATSKMRDIDPQLKSALFKKAQDTATVKDLLETYGPFFASIARANSPEEVKNLLVAYAVPPTSYKVKHETLFGIELNGYLGFVGGTRFSPKEKFPSSLGIFAPVGLSFNLGLHRISSKWSSISLFLGIIDVGALTTLELTSGTPQLPELTWANIIAPSAFFVWGIYKTPISIGIGTQFGPGFQSTGTGPLKLADFAWRGLAVFAAIDVPVFTFYTVR